MSSPVSPSAMFAGSPRSQTPFIVSTHPESLPTFPIEVQKRILYFALYLPPRYTFDPDKRPTSPLTGHIVRQNDTRRVVERLGTHRAALNLMRVCKAWKKEAAEYLYAEPHLTPSNLFLFAHALSLGDKKWSDLHLHPVSTPGRYVTSLDLSHLSGYDAPHPTALHRVLRELLPLIPNLQHLRLPSSAIPLAEVARAPFARKLRVLEGLQVTYDEVDPALKLLRNLPNLEMVSLYGPGNTDTTLYPAVDLHLERLDTLILSSIKSGPVMNALISADLPSLRNLALTSYAGCIGDMTVSFQQNCPDITDLTYLQPREWPGFLALPPLETLEMHSSLERLSYLHKDVEHMAELLNTQRLEELRITKWTSARDLPSSLFDKIITDPGTLRRVVIDGYRWVRADIGMRALQTGDSGEMRRWAERLRLVGVDLLDMDGKQPVFCVDQQNQAQRRRSSVRYVSDRLDEDGG